MGTLTLVYDCHASELNDKMNDLQHEFFNLIVSVLHVHISRDDCMEVIILGGVKHGKLFITLPAQEIVEQKKTCTHSHSHLHESGSGKNPSRI